MKIILLGSAFPLRGGLASFNERLAQQLIEEGHEVCIYTFSLQYPNFLFPGKTQMSSDAAPENLLIKIKINSINPLNWLSVGLQLRKEKADLILYKFWLPFMGPCFGTILRIATALTKTKIVSILDNVIPHEKRFGDYIFTKYGLAPAHAAIAMSKSVQQDYHSFFSNKNCLFIPHPVYDNFGNPVSKQEARAFLKLNDSDKIILFFGFIRNYKGLDILLEAMNTQLVRNLGVKLIVAGEYYEDSSKYNSLIEQYQLQNNLVLATDFISNDEVKYYFGAADCVVQPYKTATQSGISQMAYFFEKPMIVTNVGGLPEIVHHEKTGYVVATNAEAIAQAIADFYNKNVMESMVEAAKEEKKKYAWNTMTAAIMSLCK